VVADLTMVEEEGGVVKQTGAVATNYLCKILSNCQEYSHLSLEGELVCVPGNFTVNGELTTARNVSTIMSVFK
jgi:predicted acyltransferase (DUF342 family)